MIRLAAIFPALVAALLIVSASCSHAQMVEIVSDRPVVFQDSTNMVDWQDLAECASLQTLPAGNRFFRGKLRTAAVCIPIPMPGTNIIGVRAYNGPAAGDYREVCAFPRTNRLEIGALTVWPTNHLAFTYFTRAEESDFGLEQATNITARLSIRKL